MIEYVVVYCEGYEGHVLLVEKNRPAKMAGRLNLPGGKIDPTDSGPIEAAIRELKEESGLDGINPEYCGKILVKRDCTDNEAIIHCIKTTIPEFQTINPRPCETEIVRWYNWQKVITDSRLMPNLRITIPLMRAGITGWTIEDSISSYGKHIHQVLVEVPTYHQLTSK